MTPHLRALALQWVLWAAINRVGPDGLRFAGRLVLARLLWPDAFGLFALAMVIVASVQILCELEFSRSIVRRERLTPELLATAHWTVTALGALGTLAVMVLAGPLASLAGQREVAAIVRLLGVKLFLRGLAVVPQAWLWRNGAFRQMANRALAGEAVGAVSGVAGALAGLGVWSFVVQELVSDAVGALVLWALVPWRPRARWRTAEFSELFSFGWPLLGKRGLDLVAGQGDRFLVGRIFGAEALGLYALASRATEMVTLPIAGVFDRVAFPTFARTRNDLGRTRRGFLEAIRFQALLIVPGLLAMALLAEDLVPLALGPGWAGMAPFVQIFAVRALLGSVLTLPASALIGRGRQWRAVTLSLCRVAACALAWSIGLRWGPIGVATAGVIAAAVLVPIAIRMVKSELAIGVWDWTRALLPAAIGGLGMSLGIEVALWLLGGWERGRVLQVAAVLLAGGVGYALPLGPWLAREARRHLRLLREPAAHDPIHDQLP
jgi:O-antigen/teichoic acid export membrane protein